VSKARAKKRKKPSRKGSRGPKVLKKIRLPKGQVMHIHRMAKDGDPAAARVALRAFQSQLSERELDQVMTRIANPEASGGIETGEDPIFGEYADFAIIA
jgi:hypothetical protein